MQHVRKEQISAYVDRQLDARETHALEVHFRECADCRAMYDEMRELTLLFREAERFEPSPWLWNRIAAGLDSEGSRARRWVKSVVPGLRSLGWKPGVAAATITALVLIGVSIYHGNSDRIANQAAFAEIDQISRNLAAQDSDTYNPFISGSPFNPNSDQNPFRDLRLNTGMGNTPKEH